MTVHPQNMSCHVGSLRVGCRLSIVSWNLWDWVTLEPDLLGRVLKVVTKTLNTLCQAGVSSGRIWVFVIASEYRAYQLSTGFVRVRSWAAGVSQSKGKLVCGVDGLIEQREFADQFFPKFRHIVALCDDVVDVVTARVTAHRRKKLFSVEPVTDIPAMIRWCGEYMATHKPKIWGLATLRNPSWMRNTASLNNSLIEGCWTGYINRPFLYDVPRQSFKLETREAEDVERSINYFARDGEVLRLNGVACNWKISHMQNSGGMGNDLVQRQTRLMSDARLLAAKARRSSNGLVEVKSIMKRPSGRVRKTLVKKPAGRVIPPIAFVRLVRLPSIVTPCFW